MKITISTIRNLVKLKPLGLIRHKTSSTPPQNETKSNFKVCTITDNMIDPCKPEPSVVIIGAGLSGLSAAHRLAQCGLSNFTILEATERPGGRIHSYWLNDVIAEMGCEVIEGACIANPVYNLAAQAGILKPPIRYREYVSDNALHCTSDGRAINPSVAYVAMQIFNEIKQEANSLYALSCGKKHGSLHEFITLRIQQELKRFPEEQRFDVARILHGSMINLRFRLGDDLQNVSAENFGSMVNIPGGSAYIPQGFIGILAPLLKNLPDSALRFKKPVTLIKWGTVAGNSKSTPRAVVQCCDGEEFCADYVIVTVSLGVLKEHADKLFCPALPAEKSNAIKKLGFGNADKVFLDYERPFWLWNDTGIRFAWSKDELAKRSDWTKGISGINEVTGSKHVLGAKISGPEAVVMEQASDEEVVEKITKLMRQFTGDPCLPYPAAILRSKWSSDPYFCGAFTYLNKESSVGHMCDLSCPVPGNCDPVPPILLFAGEATSAGYHSTVHGALLSGVREAERIVQLTKKFNGPPPKS